MEQWCFWVGLERKRTIGCRGRTCRTIGSVVHSNIKLFDDELSSPFLSCKDRTNQNR